MKHFILIILSFFTFSISVAQLRLDGKKLISITSDNTKFYFTFEFTSEGEIQVFSVDATNNMKVGHWQMLKQVVYLDFEEYKYANLTGLYECIDWGTGNLTLKSKERTLYLRSYDEEEIAQKNSRLYIEGKWKTTLRDGLKIEYDFRLPNVVHVFTDDGSEVVAEDEVFWEASELGTQIIMYPETMLPNAGTLRNIIIEGNTLRCELYGEKMVLHRGELFPQYTGLKTPLMEYPVGKYVMNIGDYTKNENNTFVVKIDRKGHLLFTFPEQKQEDLPFAKMTLTDGDTKIEFVDMLIQYSGDYEYNYQTHLCFEFTNDSKHLSFRPFESDYSAEKELGFGGKWKWKEGDNELLLYFRGENLVDITVKKKYESSSATLFWQSYVNGEDICLIPILFFDEFTGDYKQFYVKDNILHFDYDGKHYAMQRIE